MRRCQPVVADWDSTTDNPWDREQAENTELRLTLAELNREIKLLEPILATGSFRGTIPVQIGEGEGKRTPAQAVSNQQRLVPEPRVREKSSLENRQRDHLVEAAMIHSDAGVLLLPVWYDPQAGYVPSQMAANKITMLVPGVSETASAFEITPTGAKNLNRKDDTGGMRIELTGFSTSAAILVTSNFELIKQIQAKTRETARSSAIDTLLIARTKLARVRDVDQKLSAAGHPQEAAREILKQAQQRIDQGEQAIKRQEFNTARKMARIAMQLLRILQRQHWEEVRQSLPHPATSPYSICFQLLPEHWRLVQRIGRRNEYEVLSPLTSGNFEDVNQMVQDRWQYIQSKFEGVRSDAVLYPAAPPESGGQYSLRLACVPEDNNAPPNLVSERPVQVATPAVQVKAGEIVYVTGWVRVRFPSAQRLDHALIFGSQQGARGQIRLDTNQDWQRFELLREMRSNEDFQVFFALEGLGEMQIDDVKVVTLQPRNTVAPSPDALEMMEPSLRDRARDLFNRIPGVDRIPKIPGFENRTTAE